MSTPDPASTGSMTATELAHADGKAMGRALATRPEEERAAWWAGLVEVLGPAGSYRGLPEPPEGYRWGMGFSHVLRGSIGLVHLIPPSSPGEDAIVARCGWTEAAWVTVGRWENERREACPRCAGQETTS